MPVPVRYPARWDAKTRQTKEQNPKACLSSNPLNVRTLAVPSDPAQTPVRPVSILSFDPYHLCSFRALSLSPILSKQFKNLKSLGTVPSSGYTVPWNQRQERNTGGAFLLPHFHWALLVPKAATYFLILFRLFQPPPWVFQISLLRSYIKNIPQQSGPHCCSGDGEVFIVSGDQVEIQMVVFQHPTKIRGDSLPFS